jgi:hypothetical protein
MTDKKRSADASRSRVSATASQITEAELQRRIVAFRVRVGFRIAGPDDRRRHMRSGSFDSGSPRPRVQRARHTGLQMTGVRRPKGGAEDS